MVSSLKSALTMAISLFVICAMLTVSLSNVANARFISPDNWDPTMPGVGTNRYAYAGNDPVNKSDPNGHFAFLAALGCIGGGCEAAISAIAGAAFGLALAFGLMKSNEPENQITKSPEKTMNPAQEKVEAAAKQRNFRDLETIDAPGHNAPRPNLQNLSDQELRDAIVNPLPGEEITVRGNKVLDGNGRIKEAKKRGLFGDDESIPVKELDDDEEMAPWEKSGDKNDKKDQKPDSNSDKDNSDKSKGNNKGKKK